ncbi:MAG: hypothetical protein HZB61_06585 [Nitrospirae bacterium]|nr:hypothetical protein [Nitrospirota bacterium]
MNIRNENFFEKNPKATIIVAIILVIMSLDVTSANVYKVIFGYPFYQRAEKEAERIEKTCRTKSGIYHHDLKKKISVKNAIWGNRRYSILTDSLGFRNKDAIDTPLKSNNHRIVFIGDSFTEGLGVEYQNTFAGVISNDLSHQGIEVLNAGVCSYCPSLYWKKIKYLIEDVGLKFDELIVFIDISDIGDEISYSKSSEQNTAIDKEHKRTDEDKNGEKQLVKNIIRNNSLIVYFILSEIYDFILPSLDTTQKQQHYENKYGLHKQRSLWTVDADTFREYGKGGLDIAAFYMDSLDNLLRQHKIKLTIAIYPWPDQIVNNDLDSIQVIFWKDWAKKRSVGFLNYFPCFIKLDNRESDNILLLEKMFIQGDVHWNEAGHKLIAENFLSYYRNNSKESIEICTKVK